MSRILIAIVCLLVSAGSGLKASPNPEQVKSFYVLVPDYSKTSGGTEPAVSPDGKNLAFRADNAVWITHIDAGVCKVGEWYDNKPTPWKLVFESPEAKPYSGCGGNGRDARNMDWSPDGRRLIFVHTDGRLYLAESFDFTRQTAQVRIVAEPKAFEGESSAIAMLLPRWSPDGRKIAILRCRQSRPWIVSVFDPTSGEEVQVAEDALPGGSATWIQPWSPDGRYLAYTTGDTPGKHEPRTDIAVVSVDGREHREITKDGDSLGPSWSPKSDRLAIAGMQTFKMHDSEASRSTIFLTDSSGADRTVACPAQLPGKERLAAEQAALDRRLSVVFEKQYGKQLDFTQRKKLQEGKMTSDEMLDIGMLSAAREIGGDFLREFERYMNAPEAAKPGILTSALMMLTEEKRQSFTDPWTDLFLEQMKMLQSAVGGQETVPLWSPDGRKIALVRNHIWDGIDSLVIAEVANGLERTMFTSYDIDNVSWSPDGKALIIQSRRLMNRLEEDNTSSSTPGYPEIWLLALD